MSRKTADRGEERVHLADRGRESTSSRQRGRERVHLADRGEERESTSGGMVLLGITTKEAF